MSSKTYAWILYCIAITIAITIAVQVYWNYKNYHINKQRIANDIQLSLDNALEQYYAELAKTDYLSIINPEVHTENAFGTKKPTDTALIATHFSFETEGSNTVDSLLSIAQKELNKKLIGTHHTKFDSISGYTQLLPNGKGFDVNRKHGIKSIQVLKGKKAYDSLKILQQSLGNILISMDRDTLDYGKVDSLLRIQFKQKQIAPIYNLEHFKNDSLYHESDPNLDAPHLLSVNSKSTYLKKKERIVLAFENPYQDALKLSLSSILISFVLATAVISSLFYLLHIIKQQKQLAELKNDLISNITHEFKTPISTIGVALESLGDFDGMRDKAKTKRYLSMSNQQLLKLNTMVEKLLETASLDSEAIEMHPEPVNLNTLLEQTTEKHEFQHTSRTFRLELSQIHKSITVDKFHFENAINNIIDNAVKYGGAEIIIATKSKPNAVEILISDSGHTLTPAHKQQIFDKFYRVPKGNTHDVKGFGIGLYYTKTIIEKHHGQINLILKPNRTTFKITLPNA